MAVRPGTTNFIIVAHLFSERIITIHRAPRDDAERERGFSERSPSCAHRLKP